jgi:hypothetical protein
MPKRKNSPDVARRSFRKGASLVGAAALTPGAAKAQVAAPRANPKAAVAGPKQIAADALPPRAGPGDADIGRRGLHGRCAQDARFRLSGDDLRF